MASHDHDSWRMGEAMTLLVSEYSEQRATVCLINGVHA